MFCLPGGGSGALGELELVVDTGQQGGRGSRWGLGFELGAGFYQTTGIEGGLGGCDLVDGKKEHVEIEKAASLRLLHCWAKRPF